MGVLVLVRSFGAIFTNVINGVGKLRVQQSTAVVSIIFNIPLGIIFAKYFDFGTTGVVIGTLIVTINGVIFRIIQYQKFITKRATGIWDK